MEAAGLEPLGFVPTDYALLIWGLREVTDPAALLAPADIREGFETWLQGNALMKRTFRGVATIAGLIERNLPGQRKTGRQATLSSDILYDTLVRYDPGHLLLKVTREEAQRGLVDFGRIEEMLRRVAGRVDHVRAPRVTPLAAPMLLERGRIPVAGQGRQRLVEEAAARLLEEAGLAGV
jgi:ATP-dependent Lhr-like helicase